MLLASASVEALPNFFLTIHDLEYFSIAKFLFISETLLASVAAEALPNFFMSI